MTSWEGAVRNEWCGVHRPVRAAEGCCERRLTAAGGSVYQDGASVVCGRESHQVRDEARRVSELFADEPCDLSRRDVHHRALRNPS